MALHKTLVLPEPEPCLLDHKRSRLALKILLAIFNVILSTSLLNDTNGVGSLVQ